jgi:predicted RNase H-like HicB family nuclease
MGNLIVKIERGPELFGAWAENVPGIYGEGKTVEATKKNLMDGIKLYIKYNDVIPEALKGDITIEWVFDTPSLLEYYSGIFSKPALEKLTGINQKQLFHYASGKVKPRPAQRKKISEALHRLGKELLTVNL